ncbi:MAG: [acyl-carrier-protein] S-malonyltransferase [Chloroflexi bacterium RBG_13_52_12]|nr:MAG: [acyl-carrier-protein] S-malonyltransferase [Chloroflexi bacterium RBG_13_52_12]
MTQTAWVFPGQGSQSVGMCRDLYDSVKSARAVFEQADEALGFPISRLCFEGPEDELRQTINAQPALVTAGYACLEAVREISGDKLPAPSFLAGHSLGEYTALAVAGVLDFTTAVRLARERGRLMHEAGQKRPGAMSAIMGLDEAKLAEVCQASDTVMANINCPGQIVISGAAENIKKAMELATAAGASRAIPLQVSGAFHSPLMQPAIEGMIKYLDATAFKIPSIPVIGNVTALPLASPEDVKTELRRQLTSPVRWQRTIEYMVEQGVTAFIEIGPAKVLTGLIRRINKEVAVQNLGDLAAIKALLNS